MGVIRIAASPSPSITTIHHGSRSSKRNSGRFMASALPTEQVDGTRNRVTGDSFIRLHLKKLSPYQPILPFEVLSTLLGRKPEDIIKLDANENPYGPPPEASSGFFFPPLLEYVLMDYHVVGIPKVDPPVSLQLFCYLTLVSPSFKP